MTAGYLMGLDAGGSNGRCLLLDIASGSTSVVCRPWRRVTVRRDGPWTFDLDTVSLWRQLGEISRAALDQQGIAPEQVLGVAVSSQRHGMVLLGEDGEPLFATPNRDARAATQAVE